MYIGCHTYCSAKVSIDEANSLTSNLRFLYQIKKSVVFLFELINMIRYASYFIAKIYEVEYIHKHIMYNISDAATTIKI